MGSQRIIYLLSCGTVRPYIIYNVSDSKARAQLCAVNEDAGHCMAARFSGRNDGSAETQAYYTEYDLLPAECFFYCSLVSNTDGCIFALRTVFIFLFH